MQLEEAIKKRKSIRKFLGDKPIDDADLRAILELGIRAPTAGNVQPWVIYVVRKKETRDLLTECAYGQAFISQAPVSLVICIDKKRALSTYGQRGVELYSIQDTSALIEHILLSAVDRGLGTCWVGAFDEQACHRVLALPNHLRPVAIIALGYPAEEPGDRGRRPLSEVTVWD